MRYSAGRAANFAKCLPYELWTVDGQSATRLHQTDPNSQRLRQAAWTRYRGKWCGLIIDRSWPGGDYVVISRRLEVQASTSGAA